MALVDAVRALDPAAVKAALAATGSPATATGNNLLAEAFAALVKAKSRIFSGGGRDVEPTDRRFTDVVKALLAAGVKPPKAITPGWVPSAVARSRDASMRVTCAQPFEVALSTEGATGALRELVSAGLSVQGTCDGRCGGFRAPLVGRCCAFLQPLITVLSFGPQDFAKTLATVGGNRAQVCAALVPAELLRVLVSAGAGGVIVPTDMFGPLPAAHFALLRLVLSEVPEGVDALIAVGVPVDWDCAVPLPPPSPPARKSLRAGRRGVARELVDGAHDAPRDARGADRVDRGLGEAPHGRPLPRDRRLAAPRGRPAEPRRDRLLAALRHRHERPLDARRAGRPRDHARAPPRGRRPKPA